MPLAAEGVASGNGSGSEGLTATPDGRRVIVCDNDTTALRIIDATTDREIGSVQLKPFVFTNVKRSRMAKVGVLA